MYLFIRNLMAAIAAQMQFAALIEARRVGEIGKAELRLFFALLEHKESGERAAGGCDTQ